MKKTLMILLIAIIGLCFASMAGAQGMKAGLGAGFYLPTGDAGDAFDPSPGLHGTFLYNLQEGMDIEAGLGYWMLQDANDYEGFSASYMPITAGVRYFMSPSLHFDGGAGMYVWSMEWDVDLGEWGSTTWDDSGSDLGIYLGAGYLLNDSIDINARMHYPDFEDFYIGLSVGYLFNIGGK